MRISDWSSDVCSSDLWPCNQIVTKWALVFHFFCRRPALASVPSLALLRACVKRQTAAHGQNRPRVHLHHRLARVDHWRAAFAGYYRTLSTQFVLLALQVSRSEEHTSELQSLMRISYAVFCLKKKIKSTIHQFSVRPITETQTAESTHRIR